MHDMNILYPNPAENFVIFNLTQYSFSKSELKIFDTQGKLIIRKKITEPLIYQDLSSMTKGIYIVRLTMDNKTINRKIIKK